MSLFVNTLEQTFFREHFGNINVTKEFIKDIADKERYDMSNKVRTWKKFEDYFEPIYDSVTDEEFIDFRTRFTYCKIEQNNVYEYEPFKSPKNQFTRGEPKDKLGTIKDDIIYSLDNKPIACKVGGLKAYHYYNIPFMFAGIPTEIICQLPKDLKNDKSYYFTLNWHTDDFERFEHHYVRWDFYKSI